MSLILGLQKWEIISHTEKKEMDNLPGYLQWTGLIEQGGWNYNRIKSIVAEG